MRRSTRKWVAAALALSAAPITANAEYAVIDLGALVNTATGHRASVGAINSTGQVTLTNAPGGTAYHGFRYAAGATLDLGTLGGSDGSASGINNAGQIVGQ